jgi:hypothetical protein
LCCGAKREREVLQDIRDIKYVEAFSRLVFDLHRAALEAPMERFQEEALDLLSEHVSFDSAWWGMSATAIRAFDVHASYTYKLPANFGEVWETVRHDPKMIRMVSKGPGYTLNCELPEFFADAPQIRAVTEARPSTAFVHVRSEPQREHPHLPRPLPQGQGPSVL